MNILASQTNIGNTRVKSIELSLTKDEFLELYTAIQLVKAKMLDNYVFKNTVESVLEKVESIYSRIEGV